jgi:KDO2-lipid IV(A) lauroyltransferase
MNKLTAVDKIKLFPLWLLTKLPLWSLYFISDLLFVLTYYIARYRRTIVYKNISHTFKEKGRKEIDSIIRKFYRHLCDYFIESIYLLNMDAEECNRRYKYENSEVIEDLFARGKNIILATSHYGNWEWASNLSINVSFKINGIYKPLSNKTFDRLFIYLRGKYGAIPIQMKQTLRIINEYLKNKELFALYLVADQRPSPEDLSYWTHFLHWDTPVITGPERLAKKYDIAVVFMEIDKIKRGYYNVTYRLITDNPRSEPSNAVTEKYIRNVEQMILKRPEFYLWSHNRWKFKPEIYNPKTTIANEV